MMTQQEIEAESKRLETKFKDVSNTDIIRELLRRGRLKQINYNVLYDRQQVDADGYMDSVRAHAMRGLAIGLLPVVRETKHPQPPGATELRDALTLDVVVLVPQVAAAAASTEG